MKSKIVFTCLLGTCFLCAGFVVPISLGFTLQQMLYWNGYVLASMTVATVLAMAVALYGRLTLRWFMFKIAFNLNKLAVKVMLRTSRMLLKLERHND